MSDQKITCSNCGEAIELTEALTEKINKDLRRELQAEFTAEFEAERNSIKKKAEQNAKSEMKIEFEDLREQLKEQTDAAEKLRKHELELRKKTRALEEEKKNMDIENERKLDEERETIAEKISEKLEEKHRLDDMAKDKKLQDVMKQLEEAQRKAKQGSQQTQGEVAELDFEERLIAQFPFDRITPVAKGVKGADVQQTVKNETLTECGTIIWEMKRTKNWSGAWIQKVKDDQREAKADIAVIVSEALPEGVESFDQIDGVWVVGFRFATNLAVALRSTLIQIFSGKAAETGKSQKMEILYDYLYGPEFKQRVEAMVEAFGSMRDQLSKEQNSMTRIWAKREKEISRYEKAVSGMYGDMEGIVGLSLPAINQLQLSEGDSPDEE